MRLIGVKFPKLSAFTDDDEVQEYIIEDLMERSIWWDIPDEKYAYGLIEDIVKVQTGEDMYIGIRHENDYISVSTLSPEELVREINNLMDEAEAAVRKIRDRRRMK